MPPVAERRRHHTARGVVPVGIEVLALVQRQVLDQRLAPDPLALRARTPDRLVAVLATGVHDIERHARHVGDHDRAVGGLALHLRRAGVGVRLGSGIALAQQAGGELGHHVAVLGMDHGDAAHLPHALEAREELVVVDHQRALVGEEMLEGGDAALGDLGHLIEHLLPPPGHRHVVGVVAVRASRLVVPHLEGVEQPLTGSGQREVDDHRGPARQRRARPALEVVGGIGAHERHLEMRVRVDPARHDVAACGVEHLVAGEVRADLRDAAGVDEDVGAVGEVVGDDGAVLDDGGHGEDPSSIGCFFGSEPQYCPSYQNSSSKYSQWHNTIKSAVIYIAKLSLDSFSFLYFFFQAFSKCFKIAGYLLT